MIVFCMGIVRILIDSTTTTTQNAMDTINPRYSPFLAFGKFSLIRLKISPLLNDITIEYTKPTTVNIIVAKTVISGRTSLTPLIKPITYKKVVTTDAIKLTHTVCAVTRSNTFATSIFFILFSPLTLLLFCFCPENYFIYFRFCTTSPIFAFILF